MIELKRVTQKIKDLDPLSRENVTRRFAERNLNQMRKIYGQGNLNPIKTWKDFNTFDFRDLTGPAFLRLGDQSSRLFNWYYISGIKYLDRISLIYGIAHLDLDEGGFAKGKELKLGASTYFQPCDLSLTTCPTVCVDYALWGWDLRTVDKLLVEWGRETFQRLSNSYEVKLFIPGSSEKRKPVPQKTGLGLPIPLEI